MPRKRINPQHPLWGRYKLIHYHTTCETSPRWDTYGGRGIQLCPKWRRDFWSFADWIEQNIGLPQSQFDYLARLDINKDYKPGNVYWATPKEKSNRTLRCRMIRIGKREQSLQLWLEELGISQATFHHRLRRGLPIKQCLGLT